LEFIAMQTITDKHEHTVIEQLGGLKVIKTIVKWQGKPGRDPHCLARIYVNQQKGTAIALLSEIRSNFWNRNAIATNITMIATLIVQTFGTEIGVPPEKIRWLPHYGQFSDFEIDDGYPYVREDRLVWTGMKFEERQQLDRILEKNLHKQLQETGDDIPIEDVFDVVRQLGWRER
jgi:hypothetical protein